MLPSNPDRSRDLESPPEPGAGAAARMAPLSAVEMASPSAWALTVNGPRDTDQLTSASARNGICARSSLSERSCGAAVSNASLIALSAMPTGVTMTELRVTGASGGILPGVGGGAAEPTSPILAIPQAAPAIMTTPMAAPKASFRLFECISGFPCFPGAAQHAMLRCWPGIVTNCGGPGLAVHRSRAAPHPGQAF